MIRVALMQCRAALASTTVVVAAFVIVLILHGNSARGLAEQVIEPCRAPRGAACDASQTALFRSYALFADYYSSLVPITVLIAVGWGAPLVAREVASGTGSIAWCQSVTRRHWFLSQLMVRVTALALLGLALGSTLTWFLDSFSGTPSFGETAVDDLFVHGPVLPAFWISGFLVGVLVGTLIPHPIAAMTITGALTFAGVSAFNLLYPTHLNTRTTVGELVADQARAALLILAFGAAATALAFWRFRRMNV